jgi:hypothetical protein
MRTNPVPQYAHTKEATERLIGENANLLLVS